MRTKRVDLRKVDGERNPADLLTKHSISRQRLEDLVEIFGCKYLGGRAQSAPQTKVGGTGRITMAQADETLASTIAGGAETPHTSQEEASPIMPHMRYSAEQLDKLFPALEAPPEEGLEDLNKDDQDGVFQHGMKIAQAIQAEADADGRRRRPRSDPSQTLQLLQHLHPEESLDLAKVRAGVTGPSYAPPAVATQARRQLSVARNRKEDEKGEEGGCSNDEFVESEQFQELHDEAKPDCPSGGISVNRVRARFARCAQFPTRRAAPCTDLPGSECAYARRLLDGEYADAGAVECSSEFPVQSFQVHQVGSGALPSTQAITVGRARGSGDLCCVKPLALGGPRANRRLPSATTLTSSPLESWTRLL